MDTLITFIGRGQLNTRYAKTVYSMDLNGERRVTDPTACLGLALEKLLRPRKLVILGTAGSSWIELLNHFGKEKIPNYEELHDYFASLSCNAENHSGSPPDGQILLNNIRGLQDNINTVLNGCETVIRIVPADFSPDSQAAFYQTIFETVSPGETVAVDITHGFRGVPVICLSAAYYLVFVKHVKLRSIYYGFFENPHKKDGITEVVELSGIRELMDWTFAFAKFEKSQDLSCFSEPLKRDSPGNADKASNANITDNNSAHIVEMNSFSFYERITCPYLFADRPVPDYLEQERQKKTTMLRNSC